MAYTHTTPETLPPWLFPPRPNLPTDLTTLDLLKTLAVGLMIVDHIGWLLFPDIEWFRVVGRLCVPIWFFLIGYATTKDIPTRWIIMGVIVMAPNPLIGLPLGPLPVLFTLALARLMVPYIWAFFYRYPVYMVWVMLLMVFLAPVTDMVMEYGTLGVLLALGGYAVRHRARVARRLGPVVPDLVLGGVLCAFTALSAAKFGFSFVALMVLCAGMVGVYLALQGFKVQTLAGTAHKPQAALVRFCGRYTLEIYGIHLLILKGIFGLNLLAKALIG